MKINTKQKDIIRAVCPVCFNVNFFANTNGQIPINCNCCGSRWMGHRNDTDRKELLLKHLKWIEDQLFIYIENAKGEEARELAAALANLKVGGNKARNEAYRNILLLLRRKWVSQRNTEVETL